ncbi:MAG TPA: sulfatase-like hydrolase/transferase, partial [Terriglobia bacterium]|nr:sulfatase-like hydrolase/transferase [Terriglobia bacterium]
MVHMRAARLTLRSGLLGGLIGLGAGVLEAARLYFVPRAPLLAVEVRYVIWFLAPLVDLVAGAVMGLALGPLVIALTGRRRLSKAVIAAVYAGLAAWLLYQTRAGHVLLPFSWRWSAAILLFAAWTAYYWRRSLRQFLENTRLESTLHPDQAQRARRAYPFYRTAPGAVLIASVVSSLTGLAIFERQTDIAPPRAIAAAPLPAVKPNVVLITLDTVRADHLSLYGYSRPTTPNLDRWARQGVV